jgi:hypothetical protein
MKKSLSFKKLIFPGMAMALVCVTAIAATEPDYSAWNKVLAVHVKAGSKSGIPANLVSYAALARDPNFTSAQKAITEFKPANLKSAAEKMAFYINAYNIAAVTKVLAAYPTQSITAKGDGVWKEQAIRLDGKSYSLDAIENTVLRPMGDARIHFAIVCASLSCPDLRREAYTAAKLQGQLAAQTQAFLNNTAKGLRIEGNRIYQSAIFNWFAGDFKNVAEFQKKYVKNLPAAGERAEIPYNWSLNE